MSILPVRFTRETRTAVDRGLLVDALLHAQLADDVIAAHVDRPSRRVSRALRILHYLAMVRPAPDGTAWEITERGREFATASAGAVA
jgi:hypothetical protein